MNQVNNVSNGFTEIDIDFSKFDTIAVFNGVKGGGHKIDLGISTTSKNRIVTVIHMGSKGNTA